MRPAEGEREAEESAAGAGGATAKDTERTAGVFIVAVRVAAAILIPKGGIVWRTEGIVSVDRRGEYLYNDDVSWAGRCSHDSEGPSPWCCVGKHGVLVVWTPVLCR